MWNNAQTAQGFKEARPNQRLLEFAAKHLAGLGLESRVSASVLQAESYPSLLDIGCGAGRNAIPLSQLGYQVYGVDTAPLMLEAAVHKAREQACEDRTNFFLSPMDGLPFEQESFDFIVAHGVWNLAQSDAELGKAVAEAARVARLGAGLFVFTFARINGYPPPLVGQRFTSEYGAMGRKVYVSETDIDEVLAGFGFIRSAEDGVLVYNRKPLPGSPPPILEGFWTKVGT